jgi:hypothetical protein
VKSAPPVQNLLFYEDRDCGFVFNATVRKPNVASNIRSRRRPDPDGLIEGEETILRYERADEATTDAQTTKFKLVGRKTLGAGDIDVVPPGKIHQEHAGPQRSIAFIIRAKRPGTFKQHFYDLETGAVSLTSGPEQVEHWL